MKTLLKIAGIVAVLVAVFAIIGATSIFAQRSTNDATTAGGNQAQAHSNAGTGVNAVDESVVHAAIADALGISVDELEAALDAGETPATLALELGVDFADVQAAMDSVHTTGASQAGTGGMNQRGGQSGQQGGGNNGGMRGQSQHNAGANGSHDGDCTSPTS
ncbi:MAG: hypothetical protein H6662_02320 [Ardenticatenaceae bacterium]|nr:hypothetical protein [Anaerolineales bacterium]MCB8920396.1 hypothetical protein [Ardenticatenaceae bacterium]MCB8989351.1 hypothetical protein [Ardenticatenaceae bacterium]MCB9004506.1 hypothetical protein [Ardenticatenaceae bacterium]